MRSKRAKYFRYIESIQQLGGFSTGWDKGRYLALRRGEYPEKLWFKSYWDEAGGEEDPLIVLSRENKNLELLATLSRKARRYRKLKRAARRRGWSVRRYALWLSAQKRKGAKK